MPSMDMVRRFAGVPPETDEQVLSLCLNAAVQWYERAKVPPRENDDLYDFWVCNLAAWMYDNRGAGGAEANVPPYIVHSVHQLQITIERPEYSTDKSGNRRIKWVPVVTCMAKITDVSGRDFFAAQAYQAQDVVTFGVRWLDSIDKECRIIHDGRVYHIEQINHLGYKRDFLHVKAREIRGEGV